MYTEREITGKFSKIADIYKVVAVVGARQSGKTTFLKNQMQRFKTSYILFDDPDAREMFNEDIKKFEIQYVEGFEKIILDEVQYCKDAGTKLKYLADTGRKLWITSSSETLVGRDVLSYLVGRVSVIRLFPFSISEFQKAKKLLKTTEKSLQRSVWEHIMFGGYPKVVTTNDSEMKKVILRDLFETMLLKDVARTFRIDDLDTLEKLSKYLANNSGGILSYGSVSNDLNISFQTLKRYLDAMEKSYIIFRVQPYHTNKNKEITKQPKAYYLDTGLRNIVSMDFNPNILGNVFENYIFSEIVKTGFSPKYWRTKAGAEVDFIVEKNNELIPIEVKSNARNIKVGKSLRTFIETYKCRTAIIVFFNGENKEKEIRGCKVIFTDVFGMKNLLISEE